MDSTNGPLLDKPLDPSRPQRSALPAGFVRKMLQARTAEIHERLHGASSFQAVLGGESDRKAYGRLLQAITSFHWAVDPCLTQALAHLRDKGISLPPSGRLSRLEADLAFIGNGPVSLQLAPSIQEASPAASVGYLYVVEGSALGAKLIASHLDYLFDDDQGRTFFRGDKANGKRWRKVCEGIERVGQTSEDRAALAAGAVTAFALFEHCLEAAC